MKKVIRRLRLRFRFSLILTFALASTLHAGQAPGKNPGLPTKVYGPGTYMSSWLKMPTGLGNNAITGAFDISSQTDPKICARYIIESSTNQIDVKSIVESRRCGGPAVNRNGNPISNIELNAVMGKSTFDNLQIRTKLVVESGSFQTDSEFWVEKKAP